MKTRHTSIEENQKKKPKPESTQLKDSKQEIDFDESPPQEMAIEWSTTDFFDENDQPFTNDFFLQSTSNQPLFILSENNNNHVPSIYEENEQLIFDDNTDDGFNWLDLINEDGFQDESNIHQEESYDDQLSWLDALQKENELLEAQHLKIEINSLNLSSAIINDLLPEFIKNNIDPYAHGISFQTESKEFYKEKLAAICRFPEDADKNSGWIKFFHALLTFSLKNKLSIINRELFNLDYYLFLSTHPGNNSTTLTTEKNKENVLLAFQIILHANTQTVEETVFTKPTGRWEHLSTLPWIKFYIESISQDNIIPAFHALLLSRSPKVINFLTTDNFTLLKLYAQALANENEEKTIELIQAIWRSGSNALIKKAMRTKVKDGLTFLELYINCITEENASILIQTIWQSGYSGLITETMKLSLPKIENNPDLLRLYIRDINEQNITDHLRLILATNTPALIKIILDTELQTSQGKLTLLQLYIDSITEENALVLIRALWCCHIPNIIRYISTIELKQIANKPTVTKLYASLINEQNSLFYFYAILMTRNPKIINEVLSQNPLILNFIAKKINANNIFYVMSSIFLSRNTTFIASFIEQNTSPDNEPPITILNYYLSILAKNKTPLKTIKSIRNILQSRRSSLIDKIFEPSTYFPEGLLNFYLDLDPNQRAPSIKALLVSTCNTLIQPCISQTRSWTNSKTILEFYIASLTEPQLLAIRAQNPIHLLTLLFHSRNSELITQLTMLRMPSWAKNKPVLDFYFQSMKNNLPMLVRNIFTSRDIDFIKLCMKKKLDWLPNTPSLENFYIASLTDETSLANYVDTVLLSMSLEHIQAIFKLSVPWNKSLSVQSWYLSSDKNLAIRMKKILHSGHSLPGITSNLSNQEPLIKFLDLKNPLPSDGSAISNLNCDDLITCLQKTLTSRTTMLTELLGENELIKQSLFCQLLKPHWQNMQTNPKLKAEWEKMLIRLINSQAPVAAKSMFFSELISTFPCDQSWIHLLLQHKKNAYERRQQWLNSFLESFLSERRNACLKCLTLLEKTDSCILDLSPIETQQIEALLNAFNNPCFTLTAANNSYQLTRINQEGCEKLKKECLFVSVQLGMDKIFRNETLKRKKKPNNEEVIKQVVFRKIIEEIAKNPKGTIIICDGVVPSEQLNYCNELAKNYFHITNQHKKKEHKITVSNYSNCLVLANQLNLTREQSYLEQSNLNNVENQPRLLISPPKELPKQSMIDEVILLDDKPSSLQKQNALNPTKDTNPFKFFNSSQASLPAIKHSQEPSINNVSISTLERFGLQVNVNKESNSEVIAPENMCTH